MKNKHPDKLTGLLIYVLLSLTISPLCWAENPDAPLFIENTTKVDAESLIDLAQVLPKLVLIDSRIADDRQEGYIEGSISLPDVVTNCERLAKLITQFDFPVLFYCNGIKCGRSAKAIKIAQSCGYNNIYWFRGGLQEWNEKGYPS